MPYWRKRNIPALYTWLFGKFTPTNEEVERGDNLQTATEKLQGQINAFSTGGATLDEEVTQYSVNPVRSSGIWNAIKRLWDDFVEALTTHNTIENAHKAKKHRTGHHRICW